MWRIIWRSVAGAILSLVIGIANVMCLAAMVLYWISFAMLSAFLFLTGASITFCYSVLSSISGFMKSRMSSSKYHGASAEGGKSDLTFLTLASFWDDTCTKEYLERERNGSGAQ